MVDISIQQSDGNVDETYLSTRSRILSTCQSVPRDSSIPRQLSDLFYHGISCRLHYTTVYYSTTDEETEEISGGKQDPESTRLTILYYEYVLSTRSDKVWK